MDEVEPEQLEQETTFASYNWSQIFSGFNGLKILLLR